MRATLDIDADILQAAKSLADAEGKTLGQALSDLVRSGLAQAAATGPRLEDLAGEEPIAGSAQSGTLSGTLSGARRGRR